MDHDQLFTEFNVGAARQISLNAQEVGDLDAQVTAAKFQNGNLDGQGFEPTVGLFRCFYVNSKAKGWMSFMGISRYYTLDEDAYPEFLGDNDEGINLLAFIRTVDPTKVRVAERQRAKDEPRLLESTIGRVVPLLPIAPAHASSELEASVDKLFDEEASGDGQDADRKRKTAIADAGGPSHPPKKLREDFAALGGVCTAGKSMAVVQSLFFEAMLDAEAGGEPIPTLPFVTSSVSTTPEHEDRSLADFVPGLNLRTIGAPQRFVISSDSSHHSGANITKAEVDSIVRSSAPAIATVTTMNSPPKFFASVRGMDHDQLFTEFNVGAARQISLNAQVRMRAEYNIREKRKLRIVVDEQEVGDLDAQVTAAKFQNGNLVGQVHELEISS
nr:hypothetical protein [Tanacetum cinerariifolium]